MVSGSEIPIAPLAIAGSARDADRHRRVRPLEEMENEIIRFAISHYRGQMSEVARRLKIGRSTLYRKLDEAAADDPAAGGTHDWRTDGQMIVAPRWQRSLTESTTSAVPEPFEPWLAGDRQKAGRVAKPRYPIANGSFEVSLS